MTQAINVTNSVYLSAAALQLAIKLGFAPAGRLSRIGVVYDGFKVPAEQAHLFSVKTGRAGPAGQSSTVKLAHEAGLSVPMASWTGAEKERIGKLLGY